VKSDVSQAVPQVVNAPKAVPVPLRPGFKLPPDGKRRKCSTHHDFYDVCTSAACAQEYRTLLDRLG
jgi:hypothetical protein